MACANTKKTQSGEFFQFYNIHNNRKHVRKERWHVHYVYLQFVAQQKILKSLSFGFYRILNKSNCFFFFSKHLLSHLHLRYHLYGISFVMLMNEIYSFIIICFLIYFLSLFHTIFSPLQFANRFWQKILCGWSTKKYCCPDGMWDIWTHMDIHQSYLMCCYMNKVGISK